MSGHEESSQVYENAFAAAKVDPVAAVVLALVDEVRALRLAVEKISIRPEPGMLCGVTLRSLIEPPIPVRCEREVGHVGKHACEKTQWGEFA